MKRRFLLWLLCLSAALPAKAQQADLILTGGVVWTGVAGAPLASAMAIDGERIVRVGSDADVRALAGAATREIALGERFVMPGFMDAHTHFISGGFQLGSVDLRDAATPAEFARRIGAFAAAQPDGRWITGGDWDHEMWGGALPERAWVDSLTSDHPVAVQRLDGHMMLANTLALEMAGITRDTPDPPGGTIVRDSLTGEPTGVLKDEAMSLVFAIQPAPSNAERDEAFLRAQEHALARGVTMIHDMGSSLEDLHTFRRARERGAMQMRVYSLAPLARWREIGQLVSNDGRGDARFQWGGLKAFVDGSLGSTTAWFYEPYLDEPGTSGLITTDTAQLRRQIIAADSAGLHVVVHAIGDRANDWLLDAFEDAVQRNGPRDRRFRIEHAQHLSSAAISRFAGLGVLASMQPYHAIDDGRWAEKRIGAERIQRTYAFRSLLDHDARLLFGSDWTVAPIEPLLGVYAAVTRRTTDGANPDGWVPAQKITVEEALRAYTVANAYGAFREHDLGTLEPGRLADVVVLSENLLAIDPVRIPEVKVDATIVNGTVVFERQ